MTHGAVTSEGPVPHPEDTCDKCGGPNFPWRTDNVTWNLVVGSPNGIWCPVCFAFEAERKCGPTIWSLRPTVRE